MPFALTKEVLGYKLFVEISEQDYLAISNAKKCLLEALLLEKKLDVVIENYLEYEIELLASSTRRMVNRNQDYSWFHEEINKLNRRVVNLLSACRLYLDHSLHHISNIYGEDSEHIETIKKYKSEEYDLKLGFRVMEALRNYVQHRGFPIQKWLYNAKRIEKKGKSQCLFALTPFIIVAELRDDKKFKKSVIYELDQIGKEIDIKPIVREYIAGIANFHERIRLTMHGDVLRWEKILFTCIDKFKEKASPEESIIGLAAVITGDRGTYCGLVPIFTEFIEHRRGLENKNKTLSTLGICYVTSEIIQNES